MEVVLVDIIQSNSCYYDLYSACVKDIEVPNDSICVECIAEARSLTRDGE